MSRFRSSELMPGLEKTSSLRAKVARSASSRPAGRISANVVRRSLECGTRFMRLCSFEPVDRVGDAGGVDLQARADLVERQCSVAR